MNGRVYDPGLARFMSADPLIQSAVSLQSYNRYSYAWNSPLNGTDPSGHTWLSDRWHEVWRNDNVQAIATIVIAATAGPGYAAEYTAMRTTLQTGSLEQGLKAGAISWATTEALYWVGGGSDGSVGFPAGKVPFQNVLAHAAIGCISSAAGGGSCRSGALSGGVGAAWSNFGPSLRIEAQVAMQFIVGGTASKLGGGKFANGGITSAFGYLFNSIAHSQKPVPFRTDNGNPVLDINGQPMMRPSDVDPRGEVARGEGMGTAVGTLAMQNFKIGGDWDWQRVGPNRIFVGQFTDFANVSIGLFAAGAGIPESAILEVADQYAARNSKFAASAQMDATYTNLRAQNVFDIRLGYQLYRSGAVTSNVPKSNPVIGD